MANSLYKDVWNQNRFTPPEKLLLLFLAAYANDDRRICVKQINIACFMGINSQRVSKIIKSLSHKGFIQVFKNIGYANTYEINITNNSDINTA